jgi:hydrogenase maturation protein HypF
MAVGAYEFPILPGGNEKPLIVDWAPALELIIADVRAGAPPGAIAAAFHAGLAAAIAGVAIRIGEPRVVLGGGCFQNARLTEATVVALSSAGMTPYWPQRLPPNDGGLALGQAYWAATMGGV